jgi:hypothetical protein
MDTEGNLGALPWVPREVGQTIDEGLGSPLRAFEPITYRQARALPNCVVATTPKS